MAVSSAQTSETPVYQILAPATGIQIETQQGAAVATDGGYVVVGCPFDDSSGTDVGLVRVYNTSGTLLHLIKIPSPVQGQRFGSAVSVSGTRVVVGAPNYRPADSTLSNSGRAYVYDLSGTAPLEPVATLENPSPASGDRFGSSVSIAGTLIAVGAPYDRAAGVTNAGVAYAFDLAAPDAPRHTFKKTTPASGDYFGKSVSVSGKRIVVGVPGDSTSAQRAGIAYIYDVTSGLPSAQILINPNGQFASGDSFGEAVSISGNWVAVGAYSGGDGNGGDGSGAAYVYDLGRTLPTSRFATLRDPKSPGAFYSGGFGSAVAISGTRVIVGAPFERLGGLSQSGSAYVFEMSGADPSKATVSIDNPTSALGDKFGVSVAISGARAIVGAPFDDTVAADAGSAYAYSGGSAAPYLVLNRASPTSGDRFGQSVSVSGSLLAVGAPYDPTNGSLAGSASVYTLAGGATPAPGLTFTSPDPAHVTRFGQSVSASGSLVAVGAGYNSGNGIDAGILYVFNVRARYPLSPAATIRNPDAALYYHFGSDIAISGTRVIVGMPSGAGNFGSALVYDIAVSSAEPVASLSNPEAAPSDFFGDSVAISGDIAVVGCPRYGIPGAENVGRLYAYDLASSSPRTPFAIIENPSPVPSTGFGGRIAVLGTRIAASMPSYNRNGALGRVQVFDLAGSEPGRPIATIDNPDRDSASSFGAALAISGQLVVVGSASYPAGGIRPGKSYVYSLAGPNAPVAVAVMYNPSPEDQEMFGAAVSVDGATVAVGAPGDNAVAPGKGAVYTYDLSSPLLLAASPAAAGSVLGGGTFTIGASRQITAVPNGGWTFTGWSDGGTQNPRSVVVLGDGVTFTARFVPTTYSSWQSHHFTAHQLSDPNVSGPAATPLDDGVPNFFKFYFGISPSTAMTTADRSAMPTLTMESTDGIPFAVLTFRRSSGAAGAAVNLQMSIDLSTWANISPDSTSVSSPDPASGHQTVTMRINAASRRILMLRLTGGVP